MNTLDQYFERIVIVSLAGRPDRRERLAAHFAALQLSQRFQWFDAVDGRENPPPPNWNSGPGGWGCHCSHLAIMHAAVRDRLDSVLILEDDALFSPHTHEGLGRFLRAVPGDWGQIYLGGQHLYRPRPTAHPLVLRCVDVNRTHAYAVSGREAPGIIDFLNRWPACREVPHHIDHHMGLGQRMGLWPAYSPRTWFAGQMEALSDIWVTGTTLPERWWHGGKHTHSLPLVTVLDDERLTDADETMLLFPEEDHRQRQRGPAALYSRLMHLAGRAAETGRLPAWRGTAASLRAVRRLWHNPVIRLREARNLCPHNIQTNNNNIETTRL